MRRYRMWVLALGILTVTPGITLAGLPKFPKLFKSKTSKQAKPQQSSNQKTAEDIAAALRRARLKGFDIQIEFKRGTAMLAGKIADNRQKAKATEVVMRVPGVKRVENRLVLMNSVPPKSRPPVQQVGFNQAAKPKTSGIQRAGGFEAQRQADRSPVVQADFQQQPGTLERVIQQTNATSPVPQPREIAPQQPLSNQRMAERIAETLSKADLTTFDIEIRYQNGIAILGGAVEDQQEWARIGQMVQSVPGVQRVENRLFVMKVPAMPEARQMHPAAKAAAAPMMMAAAPFMAARQAMSPRVQPVNWQGNPDAAGQPPMGAGMPPVPGMPGPPGYGHPGAGHSHQVYNMPNLPETAWPAYASYPNYSQVTYPKEYSASAWPYIGPFYPYPQIPMGWRDVQLGWDDGQWNINFRSRTDKWWWFVDPKNW